MKPRFTTKLQLISLIVIAVTGLCAEHCLADVVCVANSVNTKRICVEWSKQTDPVEDQDFDVDYGCQGCSDAPAVDLSTGDLAWVVYSEVISSGAPANIGALTTPDDDNYGVKIAKGSGAGAANVGSMVLLPGGAAYYSSLLDGSYISGHLTGDLTLQKSSGGSGGVASFFIDDDVLGDITIPDVSNFTVSGDVPSGVTITIGNLIGDKQLYFGSIGMQFSGTLLFPNGLDDYYSSVYLGALLTYPGSIDFNGHDLGCQLTLGYGASAGSVLTAGIMDGFVCVNNADFGGTATFATMPGTVELEGADVTGTINVLGDCSGNFYMLACGVAATGAIHIGGDLTETGDVLTVSIEELRGDVNGLLKVEGSVSSGASISIGGDVTSMGKLLAGGDISGDVTIEGEFNGNICGDNLSPMQTLPQNISIEDFGDEGLICGARPGCGDGTISSSDPDDGVKDARQPHPPSDCSLDARQGIGSEDEPIVMTLSEGGANNLDCWQLCETGIEQVDTGQGCSTLDDNAIASLTETSMGVYEIVLERPISARHWTTVSYLGDDSYVTYASLPANANGNTVSNSIDILALIDYLNGYGQLPYGQYSCDIDHSNLCAPADILRLIDLLNGADKFIVWYAKTLPTNTCPDEGDRMGSSGGSGSAEEENAEFIDGFVIYLSTVTISDSEDETELKLIVEALTVFCVDNLSLDERKALADKLQDDSLKFASPVAAEEVPNIVEVLLR